MDKVINVKSLKGGYENNEIFKNLNLDIEKGSFTALVGPNGSGKSTLLKFLIKELRASDKSVFVLSEDINNFNSIELAKKVSFVSQNNKAEYEFTVRQFVQMGRYCHNDEETNTKAVDDALRTVGIEKLENKLITQISGGEMQLAMVCRAVCQMSDIMILDEPINNLDPAHVIKLMNLLKKLSESGKTVLCVLHDLNAVMNYCTDCIILKEGNVIKSGKTVDVLNSSTINDAYGINCEVVNLSRDRKLLTFYNNL